MRKVPPYQINLFWDDNTPIENANDTFSKMQMNKFLVHRAIESLNQFPKEKREALLREILKKGLCSILSE